MSSGQSGGQSGQDWASASAPGGTPIIDSIFDFSAEALGQLKTWLEQSGMNLPASTTAGQIPVVTTAAFATISARHNQQILLEIDAANSIYWQMRYNGNSTSTYKWEYIAGNPGFHTIDTQENLVTGGAYSDLATVGPFYVLPRDGKYTFTWGANATPQTGGAFTSSAGIQIWNGATSQIGSKLIPWNSQGAEYSGSQSDTITGLTAGTQVRVRYANTIPGGTAGWARFRYLRVIPVAIL